MISSKETAKSLYLNSLPKLFLSTVGNISPGEDGMLLGIVMYTDFVLSSQATTAPQFSLTNLNGTKVLSSVISAGTSSSFSSPFTMAIFPPM